MFEYYTNVYESITDLQHALTSKGAEGWRLHTCDRLVKGIYFVVMDRFIPIDDTESENNDQKNEAMICKG